MSKKVVKELPVLFSQGPDWQDAREGWLSVDTANGNYKMYLGDGKKAHPITCDGGNSVKAIILNDTTYLPNEDGSITIEKDLDGKVKAVTINNSAPVYPDAYGFINLQLDDEYKGTVTGIVLNDVDLPVDAEGKVAFNLVEGENIIITEETGDIKTFKISATIPQVDIHSDDGSIRCTNDNGSWNIECLSPDIIAYLNDLCNWHYIYSASAPAINISYPSTTGTGTANLTCKRYRGLDPEHNTEAKAIAVEIVSSETSSAGWVKSNAKTYTYSYTWADLALNSATIPFKADITSVYETTGSASCNLVINFIKPWFIIEGTTTPSADTVNSAIDDNNLTNKWDLANSSYASGKEISFTHKVKDRYFYICVPSNKSVTFEQIAGMSALDAATSTVSTKLGSYKIYKSKNVQNANDPIKGKITIK